MIQRRRTFLALAGLGVVGTLAGCTGPGRENTGDAAITAETQPFTTHSSRPWWSEEAPGRVVLIDDETRERAVFGSYDLSDDRAEAVREFLSDIAYDSERLIFIESVGPNACYDRLDVTNVRLVDGEIGARANALDTSEEDTACAEVITYPSTLVRVTFEETPADSASVELTDGWGETTTIAATVDDPIGPGVDSLEGAIQPESPTDPIEPLECDRDGTERHPQAFEEGDMSWGNVEHDGEVILGLRIDDTEFEYGDTARIQLTNVASETVNTGNRAKYNVQAYTEAGWQDVRVGDSERFFGYTDEAIVHSPGDGFNWTFELTEDGIVADAFHDHLTVCPELSEGRYRFVFWGVIGGAVAVAFDLRT